jgi:NAD/NADP transhydrogenase beta subunit
VAAFHSLVGFAATLTALGEFISHNGALDLGSQFATFLAVLVGSVTASGSIVAFLKLNGALDSKPFIPPFKNVINSSLVVICGMLGIFAASLTPESPLHHLTKGTVFI